MLWLTDPALWTALLQIIAIDLLLGGDNAVVIALACRNLPHGQRRKAILGGVAGAIALRVVLLFFAMKLLSLPYLKLAGAALLLWIGIKLLIHQDEGHGEIRGEERLWSAIKTIIIADAVMSLDNVLAVAAAGAGNIYLVSFGVLISIPIIVLGSRLVLMAMERFPVVIQLGGALIGWIAGGMAVAEPALAGYLPWPDRWEHYVGSVLGAALVLVAGWGWNRRQSRARLAARD
ncbi:MAG: TerC family protein [Pseudomonas sp.]|nr:TerC family protein [Pseudomonas sp.]